MSSTRAGTLKGKLAYMSPEQVHGEQIDRRTDIFALGVVLWELTTGQRLFRMESDLDTLAKVQECNVQKPSTIVRGYPIDLEKIVMKALSKNRGERFKTAREFSRALQGLLMRRGLFIASDEVAGYIQSIFSERIQKREAHLRWAAEVTQTINIDRPAIGLVGSRESPAENRGAPAEVRPAAGARPTIQGVGMQASGANDSGPSAAAPNARHSPTVRPPSRADYNAGAAPQDSGPYPTLHDAEEFDDSDATIVTTAPRDVSSPNFAPLPAAGRLGDSGETHAIPQHQQQQQMSAQQRQPNPFAATMDARQMQSQQGRPEFYQVAAHPGQAPGQAPGQGPGNQGLGMNLMGSRNAPTNMSLGDPLPMSPFHQVSTGSSSNLGNLLPNAPLSSPMIRLAPLEFGGSMDNRTVTAQAIRRGVPLWAVALGSAAVALLFVTAIYFVITRTTTDPSKTIASSAPLSSSSSPMAQNRTSPATPTGRHGRSCSGRRRSIRRRAFGLFARGRLCIDPGAAAHHRGHARSDDDSRDDRHGNCSRGDGDRTTYCNGGARRAWAHARGHSERFARHDHRRVHARVRSSDRQRKIARALTHFSSEGRGRRASRATEKRPAEQSGEHDRDRG